MAEKTLQEMIMALRKGAGRLSSSSDKERQDALLAVASALDSSREIIRKANEEDLKAAEERGIQPALLKRLAFTDEKIDSSIQGLRELCQLPDPIGRTLEKRELDPGFVLERVSFPIGVIAMIFEARPDALVQIAGLSLRSGNAVVLKGGSEARNTNRALVSIISEAAGSDWILGVESHEDVNTLLGMDKYIDLVIPRGSNAFVRYVMEHTRIPVIGHADGICAVYIDASANVDMALRIAVDSKTQYPAACNAAETFLVHKDIAPEFLPKLAARFSELGVKVHADDTAIVYMPEAQKAVPSDFDTEFLSLECAVKVVSSIDEAVEHIAEHSSHHTDAIVTGSEESKRFFFQNVDSADVFCNCSTRFADGFRFGLGAEVGISTGKIHARGPVGLSGLMTSKWLLTGHGETVAEYSGKNGKQFHHKELI